MINMNFICIYEFKCLTCINHSSFYGLAKNIEELSLLMRDSLDLVLLGPSQ
jgi:hypothetical protein